MTPFALIANPHARRFRRRPSLIADLRAATRERAHFYLSPDHGALREAVVDAMNRGVRTLVLAGGDGTFMAGVTAATQVRQTALPRFVFAPAGTVGTVARNFGQRSDVLQTIQRVVHQEDSLAATVRPTLNVREADGTQRVGFTVGSGLVARFFERYESAGADGYVTAFKMVLRIFLGSFTQAEFSRSVLDPLGCTLTVDGRTLSPSAFSLIVCSVLPDLGLRMRVTYRAAEDFRRPHLVASPLPTDRLGPQWPRVLLGRKLIGVDNFDDLVGGFRIDFGDRDGPYILDGDTFHTRSVEVSAGPVIDVIAV